MDKVSLAATASRAKSAFNTITGIAAVAGIIGLVWISFLAIRDANTNGDQLLDGAGLWEYFWPLFTLILGFTLTVVTLGLIGSLLAEKVYHHANVHDGVGPVRVTGEPGSGTIAREPGL